MSEVQISRGGPLKEPDQRMMRAIVGFAQEHGYPPTVRDLQKALSISSLSVVTYRLDRLVSRGLVKREPKVARSIRVVGPVERWVSA